MAQPAGQPLEKILQQIFFQHEPQEKVQPPENKVPACPVPEAGAQPDDENIPHLRRLAGELGGKGLFIIKAWTGRFNG